jgi:murein DD-endopeptidase MepM/ murein hydrolase activator NlpD
MRAVVSVSCWRPWSRLAVFGALAAGVVGCSSDTSRFGSPNANPFASHPTAPAEVTGSVQAASSSHIASQPLPPPPNASRPTTVASTGVSGGGQGLGSYNPAIAQVPAPAPAAVHAPLPPPPARDITGSVSRQPQPAWNWDGGTAIQVGPGDTVETLARKYGVPANAIVQANNLSSPAALRPGQRIVIPRYNASASASAPASVPAAPHAPSAPATVAGAGGNVHVVAPGETLMSISRHYHTTLVALAGANKIPPHTHLKIGDRIIIPGRMAASRSVPPAPAAPAVAAPKVQAPHVQAPAPAPAAKVTEVAPAANLAMSGAAATATADAGATASAGAPAFRWPVRGRVIAGFGSKVNGQHSDGIDLAVPEGTQVRASDDGVVAYAGNELKGYGNLILIRHANGFVTAYAHASEIMVKRNDPVRRGQVIAKSGQTGGVSTPQLHFEIRKGSSPVDPAQYLPAGA